MAENAPTESTDPTASVPVAEPTTTSSAEADLVSQLAAAKQEAAAHHERHLRAVADLENFRKRSVRDKEELRQFAAGRVLEDLLPVIDNLALGLTAAKAPNAELKALVGGIEMVEAQLKSALGNHGMKEISPLGQVFDPNHHEALSQQASDEVPEGSVVQVIRIGYSLNGRLLRPASVVVSSGPAKEAKS